MTISSALTALNQDIIMARTAITIKGGTVTSGGGSSQLATDIATIPSGGSAPVIESLNVTPTTSAQTITAPSGTDGYSPVNVSAVTSSIDANIIADNIKKDVTILGVTGTLESGGIGIPREVSNQGIFQYLATNFTYKLPSNATDIGKYALGHAFSRCTSLTNVDLSSLTTISGNNAFESAFYVCTNLTNVNLSSLTTISGKYALDGAFSGCSALTSVSFPALTTITQQEALRYTFQNCTALTSISFSVLTTVTGMAAFEQAFNGCNTLVSISFPALSTITGSSIFKQAFQNCKALESLSFPALTTTSFGTNNNQFYNMMQTTGNVVTHTLHFPSNLETTIQGLTGYPAFGGTASKIVLAFDLPATS